MERFAVKWLRRLPPRCYDFSLKFWAVCASHKIGTLAANAAFWTVFSLPWLVLAIASTLGVISRVSTPEIGIAVRRDVEQILSDLVGTDVAVQYAIPAFDQVFDQGLDGLGIAGYIVALYSGSRAVRSVISGIALVSASRGQRRALRSRLVAVGIYAGGVVLFVAALSVTTVGTDQVEAWSGLSSTWFIGIDGTLLAVAGVGFVWAIFHLAVYPRLAWRRDLPASVAALLIGVLCVYLVPWYAGSVASSNAFGALVIAPFVAMLTAYVAFSAVLYVATASAIVNGREVLSVAVGQMETYRRLTSHTSIEERPSGAR